MFKFTVKVNMEAMLAKFETTRKQVQFATAVALTKTGQDVRDALKGGMSTSFESVTTYTKNSLYLSGATKDRLSATIGVKGEERGAVRWLRPEIYGGYRQKGLENLLAKAGLPPPGMFAVPGKAAKMSGKRIDINWVADLVGAILVQGQSGQTLRKGKGRNAKRGFASQYFVLKQRHGKLLPGIYGRQGRVAYPYILFVGRPSYRKKYDFFGIAQATAREKFPVRFKEALKRALQTAR